MSDRGRDTSRELTEVRTVLSRARTAFRTLRRIEDTTPEEHRDPDLRRMCVQMAGVLGLLDEWEKTGRPKK